MRLTSSAPLLFNHLTLCSDLVFVCVCAFVCVFIHVYFKPELQEALQRVTFLCSSAACHPTWQQWTLFLLLQPTQGVRKRWTLPWPLYIQTVDVYNVLDINYSSTHDTSD